MVHALRDAVRVLVPDGILIDLRPLPTVFPIHAVGGSSQIAIGQGDATATAEDDRAADAAIATQVDAGWLVRQYQMEFEIQYYWDTTREMAEYLRTGRKPKPVTPSYQEIDAALLAAGARFGVPARLRNTRRMMLASYTEGRRLP
jgi:hypothetical protein